MDDMEVLADAVSVANVDESADDLGFCDWSQGGSDAKASGDAGFL